MPPNNFAIVMCVLSGHPLSVLMSYFMVFTLCKIVNAMLPSLDFHLIMS